jgi:predicted RNase H-like nuclease
LTVVAGVDGTKGGWVAVVLDEDGRMQRTLVVNEVRSDFAPLSDATVIGIDVPIGFGPRRADIEARAFLRGAASTVFTTPSRDVLETPFAPGLGVSKQAHSIGERVLHLSHLAALDVRLREVHPEVSFRAMNDGAPLVHRKKSAGGVFERLELSGKNGIDFAELGPAAFVPIDDVLDAAAAAWSAARIARGVAASLPDPPEVKDGIAVAIWY